jgi:hypothetical protein
MSQSIPNYFRALPVRKTLPKARPAPTSTESLPTQILTAATDCFYLLFRLTLRLSNIVGAEEIQGRSSGVAVIRPVNLLQTSTSIQRKNKPSARWEATSEFDPIPASRERRHCGTLVSSFASLMSRGLLPFYPLALRRHRIAGALRPRFV